MPRFRYLLRGGRRSSTRRAGDRQLPILHDHYSSKLFAAIITILVLSLVDAVLTLHLLRHGSSELNPVMAFYLGKGDAVFVVAKYLLTSLSVAVFLFCKNIFLHRVNLHARALFSWVIAAFSMVILWEVILLLVAVP
jgi:hypothetical protein